MSRRRLREGMIGAGAWSELQLTAWAGVKNAEIVALCDRHPERRGLNLLPRHVWRLTGQKARWPWAPTAGCASSAIVVIRNGASPKTPGLRAEPPPSNTSSTVWRAALSLKPAARKRSEQWGWCMPVISQQRRTKP